jgi:hypothetical protein
MSERALVTKIVLCPECHEYCDWCAWYRKNARECGCGLSVPNGYSKASKRRCDWGERAKGEPCSTCDGSGKVFATITYSKAAQ